MKYLAFCKKSKTVIGSVTCVTARPYYVPCPHCGVKQPIIQIRQMNGTRHMKFKHFFIGSKQRHFLDKLTVMGYNVKELVAI